VKFTNRNSDGCRVQYGWMLYTETVYCTDREHAYAVCVDVLIYFSAVYLLLSVQSVTLTDLLLDILHRHIHFIYWVLLKFVSCPYCHPTNSVKALKGTNWKSMLISSKQVKFYQYCNTTSLSFPSVNLTTVRLLNCYSVSCRCILCAGSAEYGGIC